MSSNFLTRRELSVRLLSMLSAIGFVGKTGAMTGAVPLSANDEISRTCECIHQETVIKASRARVYQALSDEKQFSKVTDLSIPGDSNTISPAVGRTISLLG